MDTKRRSGDVDIPHTNGKLVQRTFMDEPGRSWWKCLDCGASSSVMPNVETVDDAQGHYVKHSEPDLVFTVKFRVKAVDEMRGRHAVNHLATSSWLNDVEFAIGPE